MRVISGRASRRRSPVIHPPPWISTSTGQSTVERGPVDVELQVSAGHGGVDDVGDPFDTAAPRHPRQAGEHEPRSWDRPVGRRRAVDVQPRHRVRTLDATRHPWHRRPRVGGGQNHQADATSRRQHQTDGARPAVEAPPAANAATTTAFAATTWSGSSLDEPPEVEARQLEPPRSAQRQQRVEGADRTERGKDKEHPRHDPACPFRLGANLCSADV